ncbi:MAG: hypothetical protein ACTTKL_04175 [Treponema sp.]
MKSSIKISISLIIATAVFAAVTVASSFGLFSSVEKTFYEPAKLKVIRSKLDATAEYSSEYIENLLFHFNDPANGFMSQPSVDSFTGQETSDDAVASVYKLMETVPALSGIRIIDSEGRRVYYSYFKTDSRTEGQRKNYADYSSLRTQSGRTEISYPLINAAQLQEKSDAGFILFYDDTEQRLLFSFPLKSGDSLFSVVFYVNPLDFKLYLVAKKVIEINENIRLAASENGSEGGFVYGLPEIGANILIPNIAKKWSEKSQGPDDLIALKNSGGAGSSQGESSWTLISSYKGKYAVAAGLYPADILSLPGYVRILLLICAFITVCLVILIIFSLKKDDDVVIKNTIKRFQFEVLNDFFEKDIDRQQIAGMIEAQREGLSAKIKKSLGSRGKKYAKEIDVMLDRGWSDIISALSGGKAYSAQPIKPDIDMSEIRRMFEELLQGVNVRSGTLAAVGSKTQTVSGGVEPLEEVESLEEAEAVEDLEDAEPLESADDVEELDDAEPLESADDVEAVEEALPVDVADEVEEIEEAEPVDLESAEAEEAAPVDEVEEIASVEDAAVEEAEPVNEVEDLEDAAPAQEPETGSAVSVQEPAEDTGDVDCTDDFLSDIEEDEPVQRSGAFDPDLQEEAKFGMPITAPADDGKPVDNSVSDNFLVVAPIEFLAHKELQHSIHEDEDFEQPDADTNEAEVPAQEETEPAVPNASEANGTQTDKMDPADFVELEPLSGAQTAVPFSFAPSFTANGGSVSTLNSGIIEDMGGGLFKIAERINAELAENPDTEFQNLVDGVLRKR